MVPGRPKSRTARPAIAGRNAVDLQGDDAALAQVPRQRQGCQRVVADVEDVDAILNLANRVLHLSRTVVLLALHHDHHLLRCSRARSGQGSPIPPYVQSRR